MNPARDAHIFDDSFATDSAFHKGAESKSTDASSPDDGVQHEGAVVGVGATERQVQNITHIRRILAGLAADQKARGDGAHGIAAAKSLDLIGTQKDQEGRPRERKLPDNGVIVIGDKDTLFIPSYWGGGSFLSGATMEDFKNVAETLPKPVDFEKDHHREWINACKGGPKALSNFDYAGPMTEAVLLGNVALRARTKILWDARPLDPFAN